MRHDRGFAFAVSDSDSSVAAVVNMAVPKPALILCAPLRMEPKAVVQGLGELTEAMTSDISLGFALDPSEILIGVFRCGGGLPTTAFAELDRFHL
jgi:hypothetical protein